MSTRRPRRRTDDLTNVAMVRRSPRLSSRPPLAPSTQYSRSSLSTHTTRRRRSKSRSVSPSAILNESGQSVPVTFEDARDSVDRDEREGMPRHLYGLDNDGLGRKDAEPSRLWNMYDKERVIITAPLTRDFEDGGSNGFCYKVVQFFTSVLFKLGSLLYLAAAAILHLDVILLHRLFDFASLSQRAGSISRFAILLVALCGLVGLLLGGQLFPAVPDAVPDPEPMIIKPLNNSDLEAMRQSIVQSITAKLESDMKKFESRYRSEMEAYVNSVLEKTESKLKDNMKEGLAGESERSHRIIHLLEEKLANEINITVERRILELKRSMESRYAGSSGDLDDARKAISDEIDDLRDTQGRLSREIKEMVGRMEDKQKLLDVNMSAVQLNIERHTERLYHLEEKERQILAEITNFKADILGRLKAVEAVMNESVSANTVVNIFNEELEKATADKDSPLRQWLNLVFASKNDLQDIHKLIDELRAHCGTGNGVGTVDVTRKDIEDMIAFSLRRYSADRIGKFDFALESSGGGIMLDHCSPSFTHSLHSISLFGIIPLWHIMSTPKVIIQPSLYPGNCWAMEGQSGYATIKLRDEVVVTGVTVDHIPPELSPNGTLDTAPKDFAVLGLTTLEDEPVPLGTFSYDLTGPPIQEFVIEEKMQQTSPFHFVRFEFLSNYGNLNYTCLYRIRVHGHYP